MQFVLKDVFSTFTHKMYVILFIYHRSKNCIIVLGNINTLGFDINNLVYVRLRFVVVINTLVIININNQYSLLTGYEQSNIELCCLLGHQYFGCCPLVWSCCFLDIKMFWGVWWNDQMRSFFTLINDLVIFFGTSTAFLLALSTGSCVK